MKKMIFVLLILLSNPLSNYGYCCDDGWGWGVGAGLMGLGLGAAIASRPRETVVYQTVEPDEDQQQATAQQAYEAGRLAEKEQQLAEREQQLEQRLAELE